MANPNTRIIAFMNQKGGVGKTTTTVNIGAAIAEQGKRVLLIDLDPQAHLTINYGVNPTDDTLTLYHVLVDETPLLEAVIGIDKGIALVPSSIDLAAAEIELVSVLGRELLLKKRIEAAIADASGEFDYDYVLLDCPPSLGLLTLNGLAVADEVLIPMQPQFLPLQGVAKLLETVKLVNQRMNPKLKVGGIILTMYDAQAKLSADVIADLDAFIDAAQGKNLPWSGAKVFRNRIRRNIKLAESPSFGQHILQYDPHSNGANDYRAVAREVLGLPDAAPSVTTRAGRGGKVPIETVPIGPATAATASPAPPASPVPPAAAQPAPATAVSVTPTKVGKATRSRSNRRKGKGQAAAAAAAQPSQPASARTVEVAVNPDIEAARLAAARVEPSAAGSRDSHGPAAGGTAEPAGKSAANGAEVAA